AQPGAITWHSGCARVQVKKEKEKQSVLGFVAGHSSIVPGAGGDRDAREE
uniref:Uncharacterized protein n=1 Tax=Aegilops tauschii subsp. strangulata TaxID=200361 RepID=A0A453QK76_AEGTS